MFANIKKIKLSDGQEITYFDLKLKTMDRIENDEGYDTALNIIGEGTELTEEQIKDLRRADVKRLYEAIIRITYPELFNEDGTPKVLDKKEEVKKKV